MCVNVLTVPAETSFYGMDLFHDALGLEQPVSSRSMLLDPSFWYNPYNGYMQTYATHSSSSGVYTTVEFRGGRLAISGDADQFTFLGPRLDFVIAEGREIYVTLTKSGECSDNHYIVLASTYAGTGYGYGTLDSSYDTTVFGWNCGMKYIFSRGNGYSKYKSTLCQVAGQVSLTIKMNYTTAVFQDDQCGTLSGESEPSTILQLNT